MHNSLPDGKPVQFPQHSSDVNMIPSELESYHILAICRTTSPAWATGIYSPDTEKAKSYAKGLEELCVSGIPVSIC